MRATLGSIHAALTVFFAILIFAAPPAFAQIGSDALDLAITLPKPVHFSDTQGIDVLVPASTYWVFPEEESLMLVGLEEGNIYTLAVTTEKSAEEMPYPTATSLSGAEDEADIHYVVFTSTDGEQLVAEGSYSGVKSRGRLGDRAKKAAAAAAARARQNALVQAAKRKALENKRLMEAARAAQDVIEQARSYGQEKALQRAQYLLMDLATTLKDHGQESARNKLRTYTPELAILIPIAIPPEQMLEITKQAAIFVNQNRGFIGEVLGRIARSQTIKKHISERRGINFSPQELKQITVDIMGHGSNALQLPFVRPRGFVEETGIFSGPSISIGASVGGAGAIGGSVGVSAALSLTKDLLTSERDFAPMFCGTFAAAATLGPEAKVAGSVNIGFWQGAANELGLNVTSGYVPDPFEVLSGIRAQVKAGFEAGGGGSVTIKFAFRRVSGMLLPSPKIAGFMISPSVGAGGGASAGLGYSVSACPQQLF